VAVFAARPVTLTQQAHAPVIVSDSAGRERISLPLFGSMKAPRGPQSPQPPVRAFIAGGVHASNRNSSRSADVGCQAPRVPSVSPCRPPPYPGALPFSSARSSARFPLRTVSVIRRSNLALTQF
jgi:hypothetical protein